MKIFLFASTFALFQGLTLAEHEGFIHVPGEKCAKESAACYWGEERRLLRSDKPKERVKITSRALKSDEPSLCMEVLLDYSGGWCSICGGGQGNYFCSHEVAWNNGYQTFADPTPSGAVVTHISARAIGVWGCTYGNKAAITSKVDGTLLSSSNTPYGQCGCSTCDTQYSFGPVTNPAYPTGWPGYVYGGTNSFQMQVTSGLICLESAVLTICYEDTKDGDTFGDPHFKTWNNEYFDYHGICDLVLLDAPDFDEGTGVTVHIRTKSRYEYSYIESAAVKIGDDILEVSSWGQYTLNGVSYASLPQAMGPNKLPLTYENRGDKSHAFRIVSGIDNIVISTFKDMVAVRVQNATATSFASSVGMMGDYKTGSLLGRDGLTVMEDLNSFGQEWQVLPFEPQLFQTPSPFAGTKCTPPVKTGRRLSETIVTKVEAEEACAHHKEEAKRDMCIFDVMAMDDLELAQAGAF